MIVNIILIAILAVAVAAVVFILMRKFPLVAQLDVSTMAEARHSETKKDIVEDRLYRKLNEGVSRVRKIVAPGWNFLMELFNRVYGKIASLERHYRLKAKKATIHQDDGRAKQALVSLMEEGEVLIDGEKYQDAERKLIEVISLDAHNVDAYKRLGKLYFLQNNYQHAEETLKFAQKLQADDVDIYSTLAEGYIAQNRKEKAMEVLKSAQEREPNNPKILDQLLELAISLGDKLLAGQTVRKLKEVNAENQKIVEYEKHIDSMKM